MRNFTSSAMLGIGLGFCLLCMAFGFAMLLYIGQTRPIEPNVSVLIAASMIVAGFVGALYTLLVTLPLRDTSDALASTRASAENYTAQIGAYRTQIDEEIARTPDQAEADQGALQVHVVGPLALDMLESINERLLALKEWHIEAESAEGAEHSQVEWLLVASELRDLGEQVGLELPHWIGFDAGTLDHARSHREGTGEVDEPGYQPTVDGH